MCWCLLESHVYIPFDQTIHSLRFLLRFENSQHMPKRSTALLDIQKKLYAFVKMLGRWSFMPKPLIWATRALRADYTSEPLQARTRGKWTKNTSPPCPHALLCLHLTANKKNDKNNLQQSLTVGGPLQCFQYILWLRAATLLCQWLYVLHIMNISHHYK